MVREGWVETWVAPVCCIHLMSRSFISAPGGNLFLAFKSFWTIWFRWLEQGNLTPTQESSKAITLVCRCVADAGWFQLWAQHIWVEGKPWRCLFAMRQDDSLSAAHMERCEGTVQHMSPCQHQDVDKSDPHLHPFVRALSANAEWEEGKNED